MDKNEIPPRLQEVFNRIFKDKSIQISDLTSAKDIDGWDSFTHLTLIQEIENEFKIEFKIPLKMIILLKKIMYRKILHFMFR
jgi:acyl carrier protein